MLERCCTRSYQLDKKFFIRHFRISAFQKRQLRDDSSKYNKNACGIQHLSDELHKQVFPTRTLPGPTAKLIKLSQKYLKDNELLGKSCSQSPPINFKAPKLQGDNINQHFQYLGYKSSEKYSELIDNLCRIGATPLPKPKEWIYRSGWTRYAPNKEPEPVEYPMESELVFDCEVMYLQSKYPVMATCLSPLAWYSWCSPYLTGDSETNNHLIPLGTDKRECIVVGHNVSYDRARIVEEYNMNMSKAFFIDTMSLHVAVSGMCSRQRGQWMKYRKTVKEKADEQEKTLDDFRNMIESEELRYTLSNPSLDEEYMDSSEITSALRDDPWLNTSSMNKLSDVAEFYCGIKMQKHLRDHFATDDINELRDLFQSLMTYCADDVSATYHVMNKVYPMFKNVVPHPVSFAALRHISSSFLTTSSDWEDYISRCERMYQESKIEVETKVHLVCNEVVELRKKADEVKAPWTDNPWLSQLDWTIKPVKMTKAGVPYKNQKLPGYPEWYKKLIVKNELLLSIKTRVCPLLLNLSWENKPIFWTDTYGWCFIVEMDQRQVFDEKKYKHIDPFDLLVRIKGEVTKKKKKSSKKKTIKPDEQIELADVAILKKKAAKAIKSKSKRKDKSVSVATSKGQETETNNEEIIDEMEQSDETQYTESDLVIRQNLKKLLDSQKTLYKIPHADGEEARVTSLISKPFLRYFEEGILTSKEKLAKEAFQLNVSSSYWVSSRERIMNQFVVYESNLNANKISSADKPRSSDKELGIILPQIIPMGTITRRAVEKTWLTASNAKSTRLGSELKSLIQAPEGYCFVGADVDSEELWIASLVGDSVFRLHGGTALGWMTLEGTKNEGTDLHSKTAKILGISRNEAKVFNYGRIYGAGIKFATTLLKKFNPSVTDEKAAEVAKTLYAETKGKKGVIKVSNQDAPSKLWYGGSESVVFNRLESIAEQDYPQTPVLGAGITAALNRTNLNCNSFLTSRINWAIQSSGVDYLHLLLISMEYLCNIYKVDARIAITVHDEVRYLTTIENKYKCAMLLQIANLWTRGMFCYQLGIENIPQSCAFFSCVDIDHVLRKEVDFDCITPSHPNPISHGESIDIYGLLEKKEIQDMLNGLADEVDSTHTFKIPKKPYRPVEELDKMFDASTKAHWTELQISKTDDDFKKQKAKFFSTFDISVKEKLGKIVMQSDNKIDSVVCDGLFDASESHGTLLDSGLVLDQLWGDEKVEETSYMNQGTQKKGKRSSKKSDTKPKELKSKLAEPLKPMKKETVDSNIVENDSEVSLSDIRLSGIERLADSTLDMQNQSKTRSSSKTKNGAKKRFSASDTCVPLTIYSKKEPSKLSKPRVSCTINDLSDSEIREIYF